jgi:hypothetical protein
MSFGDTQRADDVSLGEHITVNHPDGPDRWITGKVVALTLMADGSIRIRILLGNGYAFDLDREPGAPVIWTTDAVTYSL